MDNIFIQSERAFQNWPSWAIVYEWEDELAKGLDSKIINIYPLSMGTQFNKIRKALRKAGLAPKMFEYKPGVQCKLQWIMDAKIYQDYTGKNIIPIFLDFSVDMIDTIIVATSELPWFWVTNEDIYRMLQQKNCRNVYFEPLSIPDKYITNKCPDKDIDVIQFGRKNNILHEYMLQYCKRNPSVEYVYQTEDGSLTYISTIKGNIGRFDSRIEYMHLMSRCKISIVSTPGIDKGKDFGGIDFVTPRFYESAANFCHMIGRFTDNDEAKRVFLGDVCQNINTYSEFNKAISCCLNIDCKENIKRYKRFLEENATSKRVAGIRAVLERIN